MLCRPHFPLILFFLLVTAYAVPTSMADSHAEAPRSYHVAIGHHAPYLNLGQGSTLNFAIHDNHGQPVANARIEIRINAEAPIRVVSGDDGIARHAVYHGSDPGLVQIQAKATHILQGGTWKAIQSESATTTLAWTQIVIGLEAPEGEVPAGQVAQVIASAHWLHNDAPVAGLRFHVLEPSNQFRVTDALGQSTLHLTREQQGSLNASITVDPANRPHGIWTSGLPRASILFGPPLQGGGGGAGSGGGGGGESGGGSTGGSGSGTTGGQQASDRDGDGIADEYDAFPDDPGESGDVDGDGVGDGADLCPDLDEIESSQTTETLLIEQCDKKDAVGHLNMGANDTSNQSLPDRNDKARVPVNIWALLAALGLSAAVAKRRMDS